MFNDKRKLATTRTRNRNSNDGLLGKSNEEHRETEAKHNQGDSRVRKSDNLLPLNQSLINETEAKLYNSNDNYCFNMKNSCRIGTWNVRTMLDTTKLDQVLNEMDLFKLDLLGLCETRWPGQGDKLNKNGSSILFSGKGEHEDRLLR